MIVVEDLTKYYGPNRAIEGISFTVDKGEIVGILGLNGAGKTTTLRILACLMLPSGGRVAIEGVDIVERPREARRRVGFLPDIPPLYPEMTVERFLAFAARIRGVDAAGARRRTEEVLELTGTREVRSQPIGTLSHGYRQRVGIAQAVIHEPPLLILDEPTSGLDPVQIVEMRGLVREIGERHTVLVSSHNLPEISQTCDRLLVIQDGHLVAGGTEEELTAELAGVQHLLVAARGDAEGIAAAIGAIPGVVSCRREDQTGGSPYRGAPGAAVHVFRVETSQDVREEIARAIVEAGFGLRKLAPAEAELESIFLKLAGTGQAPAGEAN